MIFVYAGLFVASVNLLVTANSNLERLAASIGMFAWLCCSFIEVEK